MRALADPLGTWDAFRATTGKRGNGGLTFPMHLVRAIGASYGLTLSSDETNPDALFFGVHEFASMFEVPKALRRAKLPELSLLREVGRFPLVWAGGQGVFNPLPIAKFVDVIVLGDAEVSLPSLLCLWETFGNTSRFLSEAATVKGVFVPSIHHESRDILERGYSNDVSVSLSAGVSGRQARVEISRGCPKKCAFCGLGWMGKPRHNDSMAILSAIACLPSVHLQACDAEAHPQISEIRKSMRASGQIDTGCTASLDECFDTGSSLFYNKMFNFGIEAATERVRKRIGKARLSNEFIVEATADLFRRYNKHGVESSRVAWHMISGLPGEKIDDLDELANTLRELERVMMRRDKVTGFIQIRWQPLFPQPGTPFQWCAPGNNAELWATELKRKIGKTYALKLSHVGGRRNEKNIRVLSLARSDRGNQNIPEIDLNGSVGELNLGDSLPWDFIHGQFRRDTLELAYRKATE